MPTQASLRPERHATKDRTNARRLALDVLYQAEIREQLPLEALEARKQHGWTQQAAGPLSQGATSYAEELVTGIQQHSATIDQLIDRYAERWAIERMPIVDKNILRIGILELLWMPSTPTAVIINEAVELAKSLSTDDSGRFVNGVLGRLAEQEEPEGEERG